MKKLITCLFTLGSTCFCIEFSGQVAPDSRSIGQITALIIAPGEFDEVAGELSNLYFCAFAEGSVGTVHAEWIDENIEPIPGRKLPEGYVTLQPIARVPSWNPEAKQGYNLRLGEENHRFSKQAQTRQQPPLPHASRWVLARAHTNNDCNGLILLRFPGPGAHEANPYCDVGYFTFCVNRLSDLVCEMVPLAHSSQPVRADVCSSNSGT